MAHPTKSRQRGAGYIELLASSLILALSLLAALSLFGFSMTLVSRTGDEGVAYNIARVNIENAHQLGFNAKNSDGSWALPDGTTTVYYDTLGKNPTTTASTTGFKMVQTVSSDKTTTLGGGGTVPADDALRTVTVNVYRLPDNALIEQSGTLLARSGV